MTRQDQQVAVAAMVEDGRWLGSLRDELLAGLAAVFCQARSRLTAFAYLDALLAEPGDRRSCWQLAEAAGYATPRRMQALLAGHAWDHAAALAGLQKFIVSRLADPDAILVLDEAAELKKGQMTVGVARQHAGITGQIENCQTVVNYAYVTGRGHCLYDFRLCLPQGWCEDAARDKLGQGLRGQAARQDQPGAAHAPLPAQDCRDEWYSALEGYRRSWTPAGPARHIDSVRRPTVYPQAY